MSDGSLFNGNLKPLLEWSARLIIALLGWIAVDSLQTTRGELREVREVLAAERGRITVLETLRPMDRQLLEQVAHDVKVSNERLSAIAARLGVQ